MKNNKRIAVIIPYFGQWPEWIDLYFYSCSKNIIIDYYFFSDCKIPSRQALNLFFNQISFFEYCEMVSERLKINFNPNSAYKLCDLKPFYGYIHEDIIMKYDFWGFADVDLIWGDISEFYTSEILEKYDVLSTHADRISGHFSIFRNTKYYRELAFRIKNWDRKLISAEFRTLDEVDFSNLIFYESLFVRKFYSKVIRKLFNWRDAWVIYYSIICPLINHMLLLRQRKKMFVERHTTPILSDDGKSFKYDTDRWYYKGGKMINSKTEKSTMYVHFMIYKKNKFRKSFFWDKNFYNLPLDYDGSYDVIISKDGFNR